MGITNLARREIALEWRRDTADLEGKCDPEVASSKSSSGCCGVHDNGWTHEDRFLEKYLVQNTPD